MVGMGKSIVLLVVLSSGRSFGVGRAPREISRGPKTSSSPNRQGASADGLVVYTYDAAGQLTGSRSGDLEFEWVFEAGLMVSERTWRHSGGTGEPEETSRVNVRSPITV